MKGKKWIKVKEFNGAPTSDFITLVEYDLPDTLNPSGIYFNCSNQARIKNEFCFYESNYRGSIPGCVFVGGSLHANISTTNWHCDARRTTF
jgi:hypothetical protein